MVLGSLSALLFRSMNRVITCGLLLPIPTRPSSSPGRHLGNKRKNLGSDSSTVLCAIGFPYRPPITPNEDDGHDQEAAAARTTPPRQRHGVNNSLFDADTR